MKINHKILSLAGIVLVGAALALSGCNNGPATISFEVIGKQTGYISNEAVSSSIEIINSLPSENITNLSSEDESALQSVDYSQNFAMIITFGHGYYNQDSVIKISQFKDVFWIQTNLDPDSKEGGSNYQIVKIPKAGMLRYGKIIFRLLDSQFAETAKAIQTIAAPGNEQVLTNPA
jgi:hypothetical protein